jgi:hypothetical protein
VKNFISIKNEGNKGFAEIQLLLRMIILFLPWTKWDYLLKIDWLPYFKGSADHEQNVEKLQFLVIIIQ